MKERKNVTHEFKNLNTKELLKDELYQRDTDAKRLMYMVRNYDPCLVNTVKVSFRDGKYWIFDGAHTTALEKTVRGKGKDVMVECKVFYGLSRLDEMELFIAQNGRSSPVNVNSKMRALYNFGDKDVVGMVDGAAKAGVCIDFKKSSAPNKCTALGTLIKCYMALPEDQYMDMLKLLSKAWEGIYESFSREMLKGMTLFYKTYYGRFTFSNLVKSLKRTLPVQIIREGKSYGGSAEAYARLILRAYNNNRTTNRLPDEL